MQPAPSEIGGSRVMLWSTIDHRHTPTRSCRHVVAGIEMGAPAGVAICHAEHEAAFYVFGCDANWKPITDTWHETLAAARAQAESEFVGLSATWS